MLPEVRLIPYWRNSSAVCFRNKRNKPMDINELLTTEQMFDIITSGSLPEVINVKQRQI